MKQVRKTTMAALLALSAVGSAQAQIVKLDGSSTVYPISEAVAEEFQKARKNVVKVTVGISGTGGGFKKFCRGEIDLANASRPILKKEMEACAQGGIRFFELPIAYDALTVVVNPKNPLKLVTVADLKTMWEAAAQNRITNWKQVNPAFPDAALKLFGPGADSGTFDYFTEAINGKAKASRGDFTASEDDNVLVQGVQRDPGALAYFGFAYYSENRDKLKALAIVDPKTGRAVEPSLKTVLEGLYQPLSRPIFIYLSELSFKKPEVREFVEFYLKNAAKLAQEVKYVPLPARAYELNAEHLKQGKLGSMFGGEAEVGVRIEDLLAREARL